VAPVYTGLRRSLAIAVGVLLTGAAVVAQQSARPGGRLLSPAAAATPAKPPPTLGATGEAFSKPVVVGSPGGAAPLTVRAAPVVASTTPAVAAAPAGTMVAPPPSAAPTPDSTPPTTASAMPATVHRPAPGSYAYHQRVDGDEQEATLLVGADGSETASAGGHSTTLDLRWSDSGVAVIRSVGEDGAACVWAPPLVSLQAPLAPGASWRADSTCRTDGAQSGEPERVHQVQDAQVSGRSRVAVGGQPVDVWLIKRHTVVTVVGSAGSVTIEQQSSELFAPSLGLVASLTASTAVPNADGSVTTTSVVSQLETADPA